MSVYSSRVIKLQSRDHNTA